MGSGFLISGSNPKIMNPIITVIFCLLALSGISQPSDNPRLKPFLDKIEKCREEIRKVQASDMVNKTGSCKIHADNAMTQIGHIRKRDPNYDVSALEAEFKPFLDAKVAQVEANTKRMKASGFHASDEGCAGLFMANTTTEFRATGELESDIVKHIAQLEAYRQKLANIMSHHMDGVEHCRKFIADRIETGRNTMKKMQADLDKEDDPKTVKYLYRELAGEEAFWYAAKSLYPDLAGLNDLHQSLSAMMNKGGGLDALLAKAAARKKERLKNTFMPKPVQTNPALEAEFREAFGAEGWKEAIVRINILSRDWSIVRNSLTGAIICRTQTAAIVAKQASGNCIMYDFTIRQSYTGNGYSGTSARYAHGVLAAEFLCENAK